MSWLASREILPSPNRVLAMFAIFRGAESSLLFSSSHPHFPSASQPLFLYYFKPFGTPATFYIVLPSRRRTTCRVPSSTLKSAIEGPSIYDLRSDISQT